jgi:flagellar hook capping protein FlgD/uncharacterized protein DUF2341
MAQHARFPQILTAAVLGLSVAGLFGNVSALRPSAAPSVVSWFDPAWGYRMKITASSVMTQGGPFRDYSMVIRLKSAQSGVFAHAKPDGSDLLVTKRDGLTPLPREIVTFDPGKPYAEIWIKADTLSSTARDFYLYYGNPLAAFSPSDGSAWSSDFLGVYHFDNDPGAGTETDSGPNHHDVHAGLDAGFTSADTIAGAVGQAWHFNGTTHWVDGDGLASSDSSFTISAWFACWNQFRPGDADFAFSVESGFWHLSAKRNSDQRLPDAIGNNGFFSWPPDPLPDTLLHQYVWAMDGVADTIRFFYDGVEEAPILHYSPSGKRVYTGFNISGNVGIASPLFGNNNHADLMEGIVDEFWLKEGTVSAAWVASTYRNQKSNLFLTFGPEEVFGMVPVTLLAFTARWADEKAILTWEVSDAARDVRYALTRQEPGGAPQPVDAEVEGGPDAYRVVDPNPPSGGASYWLEVVERDGSVRVLGSTALGRQVEERLVLEANRPNPFRNATTMAFRMDGPGDARLRVFNLAGREVARPWSGWLAAGPHEVTWNGTGAGGGSLAPGMYLLRLETPSGFRALKMTKMP